MSWLYLVLVCLACYGCGSLPTAYLVVKIFYHQDIRTRLSGNVGATNSYHVTRSKTAALVVLLVDMGKGIAAFFIIRQSMPAIDLPTTLVQTLGGMSAVIGHNYPVWLGGKGGKGLATATGYMACYQPLLILIGTIAYIASLILTRYFVASLVVPGVFLLIVSLVFWPHTFPILFALIATMMFSYRHHIKNMFLGKEAKLVHSPYHLDDNPEKSNQTLK
jgi:glycerol-3-phosphate acyltransferase PlsY